MAGYRLQHIGTGTSCIGRLGSQSQLSRQVHASAKASIFLGILLPTEAFLSAASCLPPWLHWAAPVNGNSFLLPRALEPRGYCWLLRPSLPAVHCLPWSSCRILIRVGLDLAFDSFFENCSRTFFFFFPTTSQDQMHSSSALVPQFFQWACLFVFSQTCQPLAKPNFGT